MNNKVVDKVQFYLTAILAEEMRITWYFVFSCPSSDYVQGSVLEVAMTSTSSVTVRASSSSKFPTSTDHYLLVRSISFAKR